MPPLQPFERNTGLVERTIERVCRRANVDGAEAETFAAGVLSTLRDGAILQRWQQRSSLPAYLAVVVQRLFDGERDRNDEPPFGSLGDLSDEDQALLLLRFQSGMSVGDLARMFQLPPRPLYERLERLLQRIGEVRS